MKQNNADLVAACCRGNQRAFKQLYDTYAPKMLGVCIRYTGSRDEAQDLLHDGFIKVYEKLHTLSDPESLEGWIRRVMVNTAINYVQRQRFVYEELCEETTSTSDDRDFDDVDIEVLLAAIQNLRSSLRVVFNMSEVEGYTYPEISAALGMQESSIRANISRARKQIIDYLQAYERKTPQL